MMTHLKLADWLERKTISRASFAKTLGVSRSSVTLWCNGDRIPMRNAAVAIELHTKGAIKAKAWGYALAGSAGQRAIQEFLLREGLSVNAAARRIGVASMSLRAWANGTLTPSTASLKKLVKGIRVDLTQDDFV